jgi:hypothetical protein
MMTCMLSAWTMRDAKMAVRLANTKYQLLLFAYYAYNIKQAGMFIHIKNR